MGRGESWDPNLAVGLLKCYLCYYPQMPSSADFQLNYERWGVLGQLKRKGALFGEVEGTVQVNVSGSLPHHGLYSPFSMYTY